MQTSLDAGAIFESYALLYKEETRRSVAAAMVGNAPASTKRKVGKVQFFASGREAND